MHTNLTFRATVKAREAASTNKVKIEPVRKDMTKIIPDGKIVYCNEYNKGDCTFTDHHSGIFNKKQCTKWHICRACLGKEGHPRRSHPECDPNCPSKTA